MISKVVSGCCNNFRNSGLFGAEEASCEENTKKSIIEGCPSAGM